MKKVLIASRNPVKINATKKAFEEVFTDRFEFEGVSADSLVSDQPMSNDETLKGATNRLQNIQHLEADYLVSIEGGCLLYTSPSPRDLSTSRMPSSA